MNRYQLLAAMQEAEVDQDGYEIEGLDTGDRPAEGGVFLAQDSAGRWFLGGRERGIPITKRYFDSEAEACQYLYDVMARPCPAPRRLTPAEEAAGREINRRAAGCGARAE